MKEWFKPLRTTGRAATLVSASSCPQRLLLNIGIVKVTESSGLLADGNSHVARQRSQHHQP